MRTKDKIAAGLALLSGLLIEGLPVLALALAVTAAAVVCRGGQIATPVTRSLVRNDGEVRR